MPVITSNFTVGTTAVRVTDGDNMPQDVLIHNNGEGEDIIYLGEDDQVTSSTGTVLVASERITMELMPGDELYAIGAGPGTIDVRVLKIQKA